MIPKTGMSEREFLHFVDLNENMKFRSKDYKLVGDRIVGYTDDIDALKQAINFIIGIEKEKFITMHNKTGVELRDKFGMDMKLARFEIGDTIKEGLLQDDRIDDVTEISVENTERGTLSIKMLVSTSIGSIDVEKEIKFRWLQTKAYKKEHLGS